MRSTGFSSRAAGGPPSLLSGATEIGQLDGDRTNRPPCDDPARCRARGPAPCARSARPVRRPVPRAGRPAGARRRRPGDRRHRRPAPLVEASGEAVPGAYVVVLRPGREAGRHARRPRVRPREVYGAALTGFAAELSPDELERVRRDPAVVSVEPDQVVHTAATQRTSSGLYGLDRVDQRSLPLSGSYTWRSGGAGVKAFVIDTGIATGHPDAEGPAPPPRTAAPTATGHGTHVAGHARRARRTASPSRCAWSACGCSTARATAPCRASSRALDWVRTHSPGPSVGQPQPVRRLLQGAGRRRRRPWPPAGVFVAVAAGNEGTDACRSSPASDAVGRDRRRDRPRRHPRRLLQPAAPASTRTRRASAGDEHLARRRHPHDERHVDGQPARRRRRRALQGRARRDLGRRPGAWITRTATVGKVGANRRGRPTACCSPAGSRRPTRLASARCSCCCRRPRARPPAATARRWTSTRCRGRR